MTNVVCRSVRSRSPLSLVVLMVGLALVLQSGPARAHLNSSGMGPVYDGLLHFVTSPEDLIPTLALALLAGLRGAAYGRRALFTLPAAWLLGSLAGSAASATSGGAVLSSLWFLLLGGLVAADARLSLRVTTVLAALVGLVHGYLNGTGMGQSASAVLAVLGLVAAVFILIALAAAFVAQLRAQWARIAVRVVGSWIAATGLLLLGWALRGG
ncbi:MAG TPA: HupE/UreJ family protein [Burkholderiales bacterium]|nr:HupE/UreJ family protein [Burkholderiales bacterium]